MIIFTFFVVTFLGFQLISTATLKEIKALKPLEPSESYTHTVSMDEDDEDLYKLFWKILDKDEIQFEIHCKTTGWTWNLF